MPKANISKPLLTFSKSFLPRLEQQEEIRTSNTIRLSEMCNFVSAGERGTAFGDPFLWLNLSSLSLLETGDIRTDADILFS